MGGPGVSPVSPSGIPRGVAWVNSEWVFRRLPRGVPPGILWGIPWRSPGGSRWVFRDLPWEVPGGNPGLLLRMIIGAKPSCPVSLKDLGTCLFLVDPVSGTQCGGRCRAVAKTNNQHYCKRHALQVDGVPSRAALLPPDRVFRPALGPRHPIRYKQPPPPAYAKTHVRPICQWPPTCSQRGQRQVGGLWYCYPHARLLCSETVAVLSLANYQDVLVLQHSCGDMTTICEYCHSKNFLGELVGSPPHFNICCENGKLGHLPNIQPPPDALRDLLTEDDMRSRMFRDRIQQYNTAFSFISYGMGCFSHVSGGRGPPVLVCHGLVYHMAGIRMVTDTRWRRP